MNFRTFNTSFTTIFPASNSKNGGQLLTEWNLRSREMVGTDPNVKYDIGPSFAHSDQDFEVRPLSDDSGVPIDYTVLEVTPGSAVVNGHYLQTTESMTVNLMEVNAQLEAEARPPLRGDLAVGIRAFYATEQTVAGSLLTEDTSLDKYLGFQLVILPIDEFLIPSETPTDINAVTGHLRLATFRFNNNVISNIEVDDNKCAYIPAERITDVDNMLSLDYVRKTGLNSKKLYVFAGKGIDPETGYDTWEDATDSIIVWDTNPQKSTVRPPYTQAVFDTLEDSVFLVLPHKQVEGMEDAYGNPEYYLPRPLELPTAKYGAGTPGVVDRSYTNSIKLIAEKVEQFRTTLHGKQILYLDQRDSNTIFPYINPAWSNGDYILVNQDLTMDVDDGVRPPSTMYVVLPGYVSAILYAGKVDDSDVPPEGLTGTCLGVINVDEEPSTSTNPSTYPVFYSADAPVRGEPEKDYFAALYRHGSNYSIYYYKVTQSGTRAYSGAVMLTGEIPLAQEDVIGGFMNVSTDYKDQGYVYRDEYGRLKLLDYALIRSGTLAYQLGEDLTIPGGLSGEEVQAYLDEYVNERIVFPVGNPYSADPNMLNIYLNLSEEDVSSSIVIRDLDSRYNTGVYLHILGEANVNTTINIVDCEKIRIDSTISGSPVINVYRSNIYYDPYVFNYIRSCARSTNFTGFKDIKLWYYAFDDISPNLVIDNMTVTETDAPIVPEDLSYWNVTQPNDNHYLVALRSITFDGSGTVTGCGLYVADDSTDNVQLGDRIMVGDFTLPQGSGLTYPKMCMTSQLKVTGTFTSAYYSDSVWYTTDTSFTALTSSFNPYDGSESIAGNIAFHSKTTRVNVQVGTQTIPAWETGTYNIFYGGVVG